MRGVAPLIVSLGAFAGLGQATTTFNVTGNVSGNAVDATIQFEISNCTATGCTLDIVVTNNVANPANAAFGVIGVGFNIGSLTAPGGLFVDGSNIAIVTDGSGGSVTKVDFNGSTGTTSSTNLAPNWSFSYQNSSGNGCLLSAAAFCLGGHTNNGSPFDLIIGPGPYTQANGSLDNHTPDLAGPVDFQINNFAGLTLDSVFSNVDVSFGTNPDGHVVGQPCVGSDCDGGGGTPQATPEPWTMLLTGGGLVAVGLYRRFGVRA